MGRKLFCEINPTCYKISVQKEIIKRDLKDFFSGKKIAKSHSKSELPIVVKGHSSVLIRNLHGVDIELQKNKVTNIQLTCDKINGIIIKPNETFSFWKTVGKVNEKQGYKEGLVISVKKGERSGLTSGVGGGLCQMANMIHWLVLNSPLTVTELHHHSDALFPDERRTVPFGTGTSIAYKNVDYRFMNETNCDVQILVWIQEGELRGEIRSAEKYPYRYKLVEENNHYRKEGEEYYRISQVYRIVINRETNEEIAKELILDNHSKVMYDHALIPKDEIREV
jgi:Uncharacterized vancomycin resistance protein